MIVGECQGYEKDELGAHIDSLVQLVGFHGVGQQVAQLGGQRGTQRLPARHQSQTPGQATDHEMSRLPHAALVLLQSIVLQVEVLRDTMKIHPSEGSR